MFVITRVRYKESLLQYKIILVNHFQVCSTIRYTHIVRYREVRYREVLLYQNFGAKLYIELLNFAPLKTRNSKGRQTRRLMAALKTNRSQGKPNSKLICRRTGHV